MARAASRQSLPKTVAHSAPVASSSLGRRNILTNAASNWLGHAAQLATAFFMFPLLVRALGDGRYGLWSLVESVLAYLTLMDFGIGAAVLRYVARFDECRDQHGLNRVFSTSLCLFAGAGLLAWSIAAFLALAFACPLGVPAEMAGDVRWLLLLLGANLALGLPLGIFSTVLAGLGRYPLLNSVRTVTLIARMGLFLTVIHFGYGLAGLALASLAMSLVEHVVLVTAAFHRLPTLRFSLACCDRETFRQVGGYSVNAFLAMIAGRVSYQTDAIVIGAFLFPGAITHFAIAARLVEYTKSSVRSLTSTLTPTFSALDARGDHAAIRRIFVDSTRYVLWCVLPLQLGFWLLGREFLSIWMGPTYAELSYATLVILSLPLALAMSQSVASRILYGIGRINWFSRAVLLEAAANLVLSLVLVVPMGIEGVAWGTAIPSLVMNVVLAGYLCRLLEMPWQEYVRRAWARPMLVIVVPLVIGLAIKPAWTIDGWSSLFAAGLAIFGPYAALAVWAEFGGAWLQRRLAVPTTRWAAVRS